jgi:hypothetical protein
MVLDSDKRDTQPANIFMISFTESIGKVNDDSSFRGTFKTKQDDTPASWWTYLMSSELIFVFRD